MLDTLWEIIKGFSYFMAFAIIIGIPLSIWESAKGLFHTNPYRRSRDEALFSERFNVLYWHGDEREPRRLFPKHVVSRERALDAFDILVNARANDRQFRWNRPDGTIVAIDTKSIREIKLSKFRDGIEQQS
jgi:hypothetical protein